MGPFGIDHGWIAKSGYYASAKGLGGVARAAAKKARTPQLKRLAGHEAQGASARRANNLAMARGTAGISPESRPTFGRKAKAAWDKGYGA